MLAGCLAALTLGGPLGCGSSGGSGGRPVAGTGYEVKAPKGWSDGTAAYRRTAGAGSDRVLITSPKGGFASNVNVVRQRWSPGTSFDQIARADRQALTAGGATNLTPPDRQTLAGAPALSYTYGLVRGRLRLKAQQVLAQHGGRTHVVTFTDLRSRFPTSRSAFQEILRSWRWK